MEFDTEEGDSTYYMHMAGHIHLHLDKPDPEFSTAYDKTRPTPDMI